MTIDSAEFPKRSIGDKIIVDGEEGVIQLVISFLCPCADELDVKIIERGVIIRVENDNYDTWK